MRDRIDREKPEGPLKVAPDAVYLDTSHLTIEEVYEKVYTKIQQQGNIMGAKEVEMEASASPEDSFQTQLQEQYLKSMDHLEEGELVDGQVIEVANDCVFLDVGAKSRGQDPLVEFEDPPKIGDTVSVVLLKKETYSGEIVRFQEARGRKAPLAQHLQRLQEQPARRRRHREGDQGRFRR